MNKNQIENQIEKMEKELFMFYLTNVCHCLMELCGDNSELSERLWAKYHYAFEDIPAKFFLSRLNHFYSKYLEKKDDYEFLDFIKSFEDVFINNYELEDDTSDSYTNFWDFMWDTYMIHLEQ